jgi:hypothetical protein
MGAAQAIDAERDAHRAALTVAMDRYADGGI